MKTLYIIGNGFDLYHGLDTSYKSFGLYLKSEYVSLYDQLLEFFGLPDLGASDSEIDPLWKDFENSLSLLDVDIVFEEHNGLLASPGASGFRDRDWHSFEIEMERVVNNLTTNLFEAFRNFILKIKYPEHCKNKGKLLLNRHASYLNFNYTETLQQYYRISDAEITYIHGDARGDEIILGHGVDPQSFIPDEPTPPEGLSEEDYEQWIEYMNDQYDYSFESGKHALQTYFSESFKPTEDIIQAHITFFNGLESVDQIYILGHSLGRVDIPYFKRIFFSAKNLKKLTVTYYSDLEYTSHQQTLVSLGVPGKKIHLVNMDSLKKPSSWRSLIQFVLNILN